MAISITVPSSRVFAFSPSKLSITGAISGQQIDFSFNGFTNTRYADSSGNLVMPLSKVFKSAWAGVDVGDVLPFSGYVNASSKLVKTVTLDVKSGGNHIGSSPYTFTAIWGALQVGETEPTEETIYRFGDLPLIYTQNIGDYLWDNDGLFFDANLNGKDFEIISSISQIKEQTLPSTTHKTINIVNLQTCPNDVYLRWVDRFGQYKHFAFNLGVNTHESKAGDAFNSELMDLSATSNGLYKTQSQLINIDATPKQAIGIDSATYEIQKFVQSLETSIKCWKYLGSDKWMEVNVKMTPIKLDEVYQKTQSIEIEISLPDLYLQSL